MNIVQSKAGWTEIPKPDSPVEYTPAAHANNWEFSQLGRSEIRGRFKTAIIFQPVCADDSTGLSGPRAPCEADTDLIEAVSITEWQENNGLKSSQMSTIFTRLN